MTQENVAIIGAGLSGLVLSLSLHQQGVPCTVYEEWGDGTVGHAASLVSVDGIHSRVRSYLHPDVEPKFVNVVAVAGAVPTSHVKFPKDYALPVTIMSATHGVYILAPNLPDGSELMVVKQKKIEEHDREGWKAFVEDKQGCVVFLRQGADNFPEVVRKAVSGLDTESIFIWPFYEVPRMNSWTSEKGRVTILGDAAHAISPSSGQSANQVFEDAYTYALICGQCNTSSLRSILQKWRKGRQERIDRLIILARQMNVRQLPESEAREFERDVGGENFNTEWLLKPDLKQIAQDWLRA
ncbi:FAD/NAD(P)-binding domain-containing protein [Penicillium longicatenatum]|uniref:FAD/NAD(P)-binding domain-containing protein n=1 Tax=Penicillium longicatenatum TaxID=1561947 RepID=UPI002547DF43|nr:FAD/NAD(P)-binding domain-containing protein [Penicillium longicatenatum]KAJ5640106.1 FAD/NAD(P)-binding domain-containing protein [Penicillium longicatenatum]